MTQKLMLYPMFVMVLLSIIVGLRMLQLRFRAVKVDGLQPSYFLTNHGGKVPAYMMQAEQHYTNLYETPMLFYVVTMLIYMLGLANGFAVALAWAYAATRVAHACEHMGKNRLAYRRNIFLVSIVLIAALWFDALIGIVMR